MRTGVDASPISAGKIHDLFLFRLFSVRVSDRSEETKKLSWSRSTLHDRKNTHLTKKNIAGRLVGTGICLLCSWFLPSLMWTVQSSSDPEQTVNDIEAATTNTTSS